MNAILAISQLVALIMLFGSKYAVHLAVAANSGIILGAIIGMEICNRAIGRKAAEAVNYCDFRCIGPALIVFAPVFYYTYALFEWKSPSH